MKKRALVSVSDKTGIVELVRELTALGWEVVSTGGTYRTLEEAGLPVVGISDVTGFPEILDGRVKTLHPHIHSGILARRDLTQHSDQLAELNIAPIDLVVVNLYPFQETVAKEGVAWDEAIENIDIGGPSMLRAAAKNCAAVTVVVDPADYAALGEQLRAHGETSPAWRRRLAAKVFRHTAFYDSVIAAYFTQETESAPDTTSEAAVAQKAAVTKEMSTTAKKAITAAAASDGTYPERLTLPFERVQTLRYGENPHQSAAFYREPNANTGLPASEQLNGKELSYNNINDANAAWEMVSEFSAPAVVAVKHMNPCGVGLGATVREAYEKAYAADPTSIFGGIVATNRPVDEATARRMHDIFLEIVLAPDFTSEALAILQTKKNLRLLRMHTAGVARATYKMQSVQGGLLVQQADVHKLDQDGCRIATKREPSAAEWEQLLFAWRVVKHVKSNAIVLAKDNQTIGVGAGQMNRVGAAKIALEQAGEKARGAVLASDAFFPMPDTMEAAAAAGITAVIQPGGSKRDQDSIDVCDAHGMTMAMTGVRHFKH